MLYASGQMNSSPQIVLVAACARVTPVVPCALPAAQVLAQPGSAAQQLMLREQLCSVTQQLKETEATLNTVMAAQVGCTLGPRSSCGQVQG
jgi:hypothetical protein